MAAHEQQRSAGQRSTRRGVGALIGAVVLAATSACSGGSGASSTSVADSNGSDKTGGETTSAETTSVETTAAVELDRAVIYGPETPLDASAPLATIPSDLGDAEIVEQAVAPMSVIGEPLPYFPGGVGSPDPGIGQPSPVILGYDVDGKVHRIDAAQQGNTMVVIAAHWCPHCAVELPILVDLAEKGQLPDDLNVYAVVASSNPQERNWPPTEWLKGLGWTYPIILDGIANVEHDGETQLRGVINPAMGSDGFPTVILIDADGNLAARWSGEAGADQILEILRSSLYPDLDTSG